MNNNLKKVLICGALAVLAGCVQQRYEPITSTSVPSQRWTFKPITIRYKDDLSPASNFESVLWSTAWSCSRQAEMGYILYDQLRGYGSSKRPEDNAQALADCKRYAIQQGNEAVARLKQAKVSAKTLDLSKDLYAKWDAYLSGMTISAPKDYLAANQYETSRQALLAEEKFAQ